MVGIKRDIVVFLAIAVLVSLCGIAKAQKPSFGVKGGLIAQTFGNGTSVSQTWPVISGLMEFTVPNLPFAICGSAGFSWHSEKSGGTSTSIRDIAIIAGGKFKKELPESPIGFYGSGGPGIHLYSWESKYDGQSLGSESKTWMGIHLFGGMEYSAGSPTYFGEIGWGKILPDEGSWTQFVFAGGIRF